MTDTALRVLRARTLGTGAVNTVIADRRRYAPLVLLATLHVLGCALLLLHPSTLLLSLAATAYALGVRHAFDADHIAAIDNATRKFLSSNIRSNTPGMYFSLGHSLVVLVITLVVNYSTAGLRAQIAQDSSTLHSFTHVVGPVVSGVFLLFFAGANAYTLFRTRTSRDATHGDLERGRMRTSVVYRVFGAVSRPWHLFPIGVLFGLGFDTATEVSLLALAATTPGSSLSILALPILFAAGMSLFDTADNSIMNRVYSATLSRPRMSAYYNVALTSISIALAVGLAIVQFTHVR